MSLDLFKPVVSEDKLHPNFRRTLDPGAAGVRAVLNGWADGFVDRDNKFVREFQTTYNSSFWELYLFAVLKRLSISLDISMPRRTLCQRDCRSRSKPRVGKDIGRNSPRQSRPGLPSVYRAPFKRPSR
jgi:hypothetical protein